MKLARGLIVLGLAAVVPILSLAAPKTTNNGVQILQLEFQGNKYSVVSVDLKKAKLRMCWKDSQNQPFKTFQKLEQHLAKNGVKLLAAMNAGIFDKTYVPLGLQVQRGQKLHKLNVRTKAFGNFYMQPNGVFFSGCSRGEHCQHPRICSHIPQRPRGDTIGSNLGFEQPNQF